MKSVLFLAGLLFLTNAQACYAASWLVERVSGVAWAVAQGREQVRLQPRMSIPEGVTIATDASGRVRLVSERQRDDGVPQHADGRRAGPKVR